MDLRTLIPADCKPCSMEVRIQDFPMHWLGGEVSRTKPVYEVIIHFESREDGPCGHREFKTRDSDKVNFVMKQVEEARADREW